MPHLYVVNVFKICAKDMRMTLFILRLSCYRKICTHSVYLANAFAGNSEFEYIFAYRPMVSIWDVFIEVIQTVQPYKIYQKP